MPIIITLLQKMNNTKCNVKHSFNLLKESLTVHKIIVINQLTVYKNYLNNKNVKLITYFKKN